MKIFSRRIQGERIFFHFFPGVSRIFKEIDIFPGDSRISRSCGHPAETGSEGLNFDLVEWILASTTSIILSCHNSKDILGFFFTSESV